MTTKNEIWRIYADLAQSLIVTARNLYSSDQFIEDLTETVYALDSTTIDLCLSMFPWADFRKTKAAIKLHTLLDLRGNIPTFIHISDGNLHDVNALDYLQLEAGAYYVMDRGYLDFSRLYSFTKTAAFFVTRSKSNTKFRRLYSHPVDRSTGLICDQTIVLTGTAASQNYPEKLRRVKFNDPDTGKTLVFLTNNFILPALTIALLYRSRWQVELFFQMDQATPQNQEIFRNVRERGKNSDLDCCISLLTCGHHEETTQPSREPLHYSTDSQRHCFRKSSNLSTDYGKRLQAEHSCIS